MILRPALTQLKGLSATLLPAALSGLAATLALVCAAVVTDQAVFWSRAAIVLLVLSLVLAYGPVTRISRRLRAHSLVLEGAHDGAFEWNPVSKELKVGHRLLAILGYSRDFLDDTHVWLDIVHPDDRAKYNHAVSQHLKGLSDFFYCEYRVRSANGEYRWLAARGKAVRNRSGVATLMAGSVSDITERIQREEQIRALARQDQLTGLPNRRALLEVLPEALDKASRQGGLVGLLFMDVDRFKLINDSRGHAFGDALLVELTRRLPKGLGPDDVLVRQGGDEFVAVLQGVADIRQIEAHAQRMLATIDRPLVVDGVVERVHASIGIACYPADAKDADELLRCADIALYAAKDAGGNGVRLFERRMRTRIDERAGLEGRLRKAIENGDLELHFQPKQRLRDGVITGAEALVRWRDGDTMIRPDVFIPVAEDSGLIEPLGLWVMDAAVRQMKLWLEAVGDDFRLAINLSNRQFLRRNVDHDFEVIANAHGVAVSRFEFEVTESLLLNPDGQALRALARLRELGGRIALDDFGTGYSSLSYLQLLDFDVLKIDKSFVATLDPSDRRQSARNASAIVDTIIILGRQLDYEIIAEGVETREQYEWLKAFGCDVAQGYYIAPPLAAEAFKARFLGPAQSGTGVVSPTLP